MAFYSTSTPTTHKLKTDVAHVRTLLETKGLSYEERIVRTVELAGTVMEELGNPNGPRLDAVAALCKEFMTEIKETQKTLREQIKGMCEYRPFENCDYQSRMAAEISLEKLNLVAEQLDGMNDTADQYHSLHLDAHLGGSSS